MLAELAAINAAYAVIKEVIGNGKELAEAGSHIGDFFSSKKKLEQKVKAAPRDRASLLEEFFALEEAKKKEKELRDYMLIAGRPGLLGDWDRFQKQAAIAEEYERKERVRRLVEEQERKELYTIIAGVLILGIVVVGLIFGGVFIAAN